MPWQPGHPLRVLSLVVVPVLAYAKQRTGKQMGSRALIADSKEQRVCSYVSMAQRTKLLALGWTKINSFDPPLTPVSTAYATPPFLPFSHPRVKLISWRPGGRLHVDRWADCSAIGFSTLLEIVTGRHELNKVSRPLSEVPAVGRRRLRWSSVQRCDSQQSLRPVLE
jgi:hypothetical protein